MTPTDAPDTGTTRRQLLRTGTLGAAAAAFLAACGTSDDTQAGESGVAPGEESDVTVPLEAASESELDYNRTLLRTAISLELLAAEVYEEYGPVLPADAQADVERFAADHAAAAEDFKAQLPLNLQVDEPNAVLQERFVDPVAPDLINATATYNFFHVLESTLAATYVVAVGDWTTEGPDDNERLIFAEHASAAARRSTVMGNGGEGAAPDAALFDTVDLIPNEAYVTVDDPNAPAEEGDAGDTAEGEDAGDTAEE